MTEWLAAGMGVGFLGVFVAQLARITVPYALAALGGVVSERAGVVNLALEGKLTAGAFCATLGAYYTGSVAVGVMCGIAGGGLIGAIYAWVVLRFQADQIVSGIAINLMALALSRYLLVLLFGSSSNSKQTVAFHGSVFANTVFWLTVGLVVGVYALLRYTPFGLRIRAVGNHPEAADTVGVSVLRTRWQAVVLGGMLAGLGGAWLSLRGGAFAADMSAGLGYTALAAVIMGRWKPLWAVAACLLFGFAQTVQFRLQVAGVSLPSELVSVLPHVLTMVMLAFAGRSRPPQALGQPYP